VSGPAKSGVVVPAKLKWHGRLAAWAIYSAITLFSKTWRVRFVDDTGDAKAPLIFALWHNRLALCMTAYRDFARVKWPEAGLAAMISASKDGSLLAGTLKFFDVTPVRGSSSRRGRQALLEMTRQLNAGLNAAITPDGPKGPRYKAQGGIVALAQVSGAPIVPVTMRTDRVWKLKSWDAFQIPMPFAKCEIHFQKPMPVRREASEAEREELRAELERRLMAATFD
jgi:lysophospholipid acyltransferase (LPLAT)-like uncharacterized protein